MRKTWTLMHGGSPIPQLDTSGDHPVPDGRLGRLVAGVGRIAAALALALLLTGPVHAEGPPPARAPVVASTAIVTTDGPVTRFSMRLSSSVAIESFVLADPYRVVVELPEVGFDVASAKREPTGLVRSWRCGLFATGRSRLVLDTDGPTRAEVAVVPGTADGPPQLVIRLTATTPQDFATRMRPPPAPVATGTIDKPGRDPAVISANHGKRLIVLDPGHGGIDAGTVSPHTGMPEKQVVLEFAKLLAGKLEETGRYEVVLTRTTDTFVPLADRVKFAREHHADLFVSVHADAELDRSVRGSTVFTLADKASEPQAAALALKENQSDVLAGIAADDRSDDVADILMELTVRETRQFSHVLARDLVEDMSRSGHMVKQNPHRSASLRVLRAYDIPSVLIELGFLSNREDESQLVSPQWRDKTAIAIRGSLDRFFAQREARAAP